MSKNKCIAVIGATSCIAQNCIRLWLEQGECTLFLVDRHADSLNRLQQDLQVRSPNASITIIATDLLSPKSIEATVEKIFCKETIDIILIAHGNLPSQQDCQNNIDVCHQALVVNGLSPILYAESCVRHMEKNNHGTLAIIGSVAGDRGRKSNYTYGSAKAALNCYAQGLNHRLAHTNAHVVLIKPGPTDTPMTAHLKEKGAKLANVEDVAVAIVQAIKSNKRIVYAPRIWQIIMLIIRHIPVFVFNRLDI